MRGVLTNLFAVRAQRMTRPNFEFLVPPPDVAMISRVLDSPPTEVPREAWRLLGQLDVDIRNAVGREMAARSDSGVVETGSRFSFGADAMLARYLLPERRAWIFSTSLDQKVAMDGLSAFFSDRADEVDGAIESLEVLQLADEANRLRNAKAFFVEHLGEDGLRDERRTWQLAQETLDAGHLHPRLRAAEQSIDSVRFPEKRLRLALRLPHLFFR